MQNQWKKEIALLISKEIDVEYEDALRSLELPKGKQADWCSTIAFSIAKKRKKNPVQICSEIAENVKWPEFVKKIDAQGPYLNFYFANSFWKNILQASLKDKLVEKIENKKVIIEFPSVNPNKPWHVGHLRNALIGDSVSNLLSAVGYSVKKIDYIDDLGLQVAQSVWGQKNLEKPIAPKGSEWLEKKIDHVIGWQYVEVAKKVKDTEINEQVRALLKKLEEGDNDDAKHSREVVEKIVKAQYETAFSLGIYHDAIIFESDIMNTIFDEGIEKIKKSESVIEEREGKNAGCWVVKLEGEKGFSGLENADKILVRSDGTVTYTGKDIVFQMWKFGLLKDKFLFTRFMMQPNKQIVYMSNKKGDGIEIANADIVINVIGMEQSYPQKVICAVLNKMGYSDHAQNSIHLAYEHVVLPDAKFSGRAGTWMKKDDSPGFSADEMIAEVRKKAREKISERYDKEKVVEISDSVAVGAIRFSILRTSAKQKIVFDYEQALTLVGDSGPYIQYAYARACRIIENAKKEGIKDRADSENYVFNESEIAILRLMLKFDEVIKSSVREYQVHPICDFCVELASLFNKFYTTTPVIAEEVEEYREIRLYEVMAIKKLMAKAMEIVGIDRIERM